MTFVADQCVAGPIIDRLRADGWSVVAIRDVAPVIQDPNVLDLAVQSGAVLLTEDKDFGELAYREALPHCGIVLIRLDELRRDQRAGVAAEAIRQHQSELPGAFTVITPAGVRIRHVPRSPGDSSGS
jgi:predicted nuclease of predicted toxin-antitoxin system